MSNAAASTQRTPFVGLAAPFLAFFLSGASSLIFQSIWTRMLHHVFGSTSIAMSTVLSVFMAGLGLGAAIFGRYANRIKKPLQAYAIAELLVGTCGFVIPLLVSPDGWLADLNRTLRVTFGFGSIGFTLARFAVLVPILLVPTTLMGSTLPLLARHFVDEKQSAGGASTRVGALYAVNTFGAVFGVFLGTFVLLPNVGLAAANYTAIAMNLTLGAGILLLARFLRWGDDTLDEKEAEDDQGAIPPIARKLAFVAFGASGAAALCYEVVWTRALAMVNGSSIYAFGLTLMTFLIGIAGGSAVASSMLGKRRAPLTGTAVFACVLVLIANVPVAVGERSVGTYLAISGVCMVIVLAAVAFAVLRARQADALGGAAGADVTLWGVAMLAVPIFAAAINCVHSGEHGLELVQAPLPKIVLSVVSTIAFFLAVSLALRRSLVLLVAVMQLLIAGATFVTYVWLDEIGITFAGLVAILEPETLPDHVGLVRFFMLLTAGLVTLPATLGMGAMFPVTVRIWTLGGRDIGRDVGSVYTANTIGSVIGAWLPGFVLMPLLGMERTLHIGILLNAALGLMMLIATAADSPATEAAKTEDDEKTKGAEDKASPKRAEAANKKGNGLPAWQAAMVYVLAPLVPALLALGYLGTSNPDSPLRWNLSRMTLGVFRVSLARDVINPESWGEPDLVFYHDGLGTTVSVERWGRHYALKNNGKVDASNGDDMPTQIMVAGYPLLMHENGPQDLDVAIVGFGSGVTVGTTLQFPVKSVEVIELERSIPDASRFFEDVNHLRYPLPEFPYVEMDRLTVINDDGRNYLASTTKQYDVIMSEPSNPWITGVSDLFTTDHFRVAKRALKPGGIYCQWVQLYELSPENIKTIYRTFADQFRYVVVFSAEDMSSDTVVIGSDSPLPLDLDRVQRAFELPGISEELERAYVHSPFDVFARTLLASKEEVMAYTQIEYARIGGQWVAEPASSNGAECPAARCMRRPAIMNTDDNARIEFAAPNDLIGFKRYEDYLVNIYSPEWPYGDLMDHVRGFGDGDVAARHYAEQAMALVAHGRKEEAIAFIQRSQREGNARETVIALEILALLTEDDREPRVMIETPVPGPQLDRRMAEVLTSGFDAVRRSVDEHAYAAALQAMEEIPAPLRLHSGPSMQFLYGYLLYKAAGGHSSQFRAAIDQLEELVRGEEQYVQRHPEVYYFLARAHDAEFNFDKGLRNMRVYVEARVVPAAEPNDLPEPPRETAPTTDEAGESPKDTRPFVN